MEQKSILFYFNSLRPSGGIERVIATLANKFSKDYKITILVKDEPISFYHLHENIKIIAFNNELVFNMQSRFKRMLNASKSLLMSIILLRSHLRKHHYDYYYLAHPLNVLEFHLAKGIDNNHTIITEHGSIDAYNFVYKVIKSWLYKKPKVYIVPTKTDAKLYQKMGMPVTYIPHFKSDLKYKKAPLNNNIALTVGRLTEAKRQMILIDIWNKIVNIRGVRNWQLHIVGNGDLEKVLQQKIIDLNLQEYITIKSPKKKIEEFYQDGSVFLLSSHSEGFGMVLLEAISFGLPCISFDCPSGPRDIINNGINGYLITPDDTAQFESKLYHLIKNKDLVDEMGKNAFEGSNQWKDEFVLEKWFDILKD